jgi:ABC-2 type transport system permease protein
MSASIYQHEFRTRLKSVIIWSAGLVALIVFYLSIYPAFSEQAELLNEMMAKFPPQLLAAFGMGKIDMASLMGYFSFIFIFIQLCLAIQAANYGFGLVSIEESELTADFLLSKPVSRWQVMNSKLLAALTSLLITDLVVWMVSFTCLLAVRGSRTYDARTLFLLFLSLVIFQLFFLSVGLVVSLLVKRVRSVTPYALGLAFGTYILNAFSGIFGDVKLELITPFKHFDPTYILQNVAYNTPLVLLNVAVTIVAIVASYWLYIRRDIPAVS